MYRRPNPKIFGDQANVPVGMLFRNRQDALEAGVHGMSEAGIHGGPEGAYSIVVNGGYDNIDNGETLIYTGQGKGKSKDGLKDPRGGGGTQQSDQEWKLGNAALRTSASTKLPVRVLRGSKTNPAYAAPPETFRYDGLYTVNSWEEVKDANGNTVFKFELERCADIKQAPLPGPNSAGRFWTHPLGEKVDDTPDTPVSTMTPAEKRQAIEGHRKLKGMPAIPKKKAHSNDIPS